MSPLLTTLNRSRWDVPGSQRAPAPLFSKRDLPLQGLLLFFWGDVAETGLSKHHKSVRWLLNTRIRKKKSNSWWLHKVVVCFTKAEILKIQKVLQYSVLHLETYRMTVGQVRLADIRFMSDISYVWQLLVLRCLAGRNPALIPQARNQKNAFFSAHKEETHKHYALKQRLH